LLGQARVGVAQCERHRLLRRLQMRVGDPVPAEQPLPRERSRQPELGGRVCRAHRDDGHGERRRCGARTARRRHGPEGRLHQLHHDREFGVPESRHQSKARDHRDPFAGIVRMQRHDSGRDAAEPLVHAVEDTLARAGEGERGDPRRHDQPVDRFPPRPPSGSRLQPDGDGSVLAELDGRPRQWCPA
jgi:hypothetical protein